MRAVTFAEAASLLVEWGDQKLGPVVGAAPESLNWSLEDTCDGVCRTIADDPFGADLAKYPREVLVMLKARLMFAIAAAMTRENEVILRVPPSLTKGQVLAVIIGARLAETRLPREWRPQ